MQPTDEIRLQLIRLGYTPFENAVCNCRYHFKKKYDSGHLVQINRNKKMTKDYAGLSEIYIYDQYSNKVLHREFSSVSVEKLNAWLALANVSDGV